MLLTREGHLAGELRAEGDISLEVLFASYSEHVCAGGLVIHIVCLCVCAHVP